MRSTQIPLLFGVILSMILLAGCGSEPGPAKPAVSSDQIAQFLAENPDQNTDDLDEEMEEEEEDE